MNTAGTVRQFKDLSPEEQATVLAMAKQTSAFRFMFEDPPEDTSGDLSWYLDQLAEHYQWRQQREATRMDV